MVWSGWTELRGVQPVVWSCRQRFPKASGGRHWGHQLFFYSIDDVSRIRIEFAVAC